MAKGKNKGEAAPVLSLKLDSKPGAEPVEVPTGDGAGFQQPCSLTGVGAGFSGGMLGWVFGFGGYWMSNRLKGQFKASLAEGMKSAKTFAIMSGLYAAVTCFMKRIRQREDGWNGAAAGCATGLALGWSGGPASAMQSCALFGIFSYFIDGMSGGSPAHAAPAVPAALRQPAWGEGSGLDAGQPAAEAFGAEPCAATAGVARRSSRAGEEWLGVAWAQLAQRMQQGQQGSREAVRQLLSPAMPLLAAVAPCQFGSHLDSNGSAGVAGCRVARRR